MTAEQKKAIFEYWKESMGKTRPIMDKKRESRIDWAIANYGIDQCRKAIDGCTMSSWHMGKNPSNKRYDDISLIFQDAKHVEMFLEHYDNGAKKSAKDKWING